MHGGAGVRFVMMSSRFSITRSYASGLIELSTLAAAGSRRKIPRPVPMTASTPAPRPRRQRDGTRGSRGR